MLIMVRTHALVNLVNPVRVLPGTNPQCVRLRSNTGHRSPKDTPDKPDNVTCVHMRTLTLKQVEEHEKR